MKIVLATESYYPNIDGGAVAQHRLVMELSRQGHDVKVIAPGLNFKNIHEKDNGSVIYRPRGITLPLYMNNRYHFSPLPYFYIKKIIKKFKPDIINTCSPYPNSLSAHRVGRLYDIPIVGSVHMLPENMLSPWMHKFYYSKLKAFSWKYLVFYYNRVNLATIPTKTGADMYKEKGLDTDITPISNGVDTKMFNPKNDGAYLRDKFSLPDKKTVIYTGRICAEKNLDVLIHAIPNILKNVDAHFLLCGSGGGYKDQMKQLVKKLEIEDHVTFIDFLSWEDYPNIYSAADVFIMPAEAELQSIVTLEAIACGLPAVVVDRGAVHELVKNDNGFVFPSKNSEVLSEQISKILIDDKLAKQMSRKSLELVKEHNMAFVASKFEKIYEKALDCK